MLCSRGGLLCLPDQLHFVNTVLTARLQTITGIWHLTQGDDICHNGEAEVIEGPLPVPFK
ncbi:hypothetical protein FZC81_19725 [Enterobacter hormaechei]|uniref:Uncharacterized protein n=1 Tax=Enterobacter hormaechei TaxID=158836 RepID=A0AAE9BGX8_9ENTR|nr:hypothetical protein FZC81_19725 [Enterobacter hormaechei]